MKDKRVLIVFAVFLALMGGIVLWSNSRSGDDSAIDDIDSDVTTTSTTAVRQTTTTKFESNDGRAILEHIIGVQNDLLESPSIARVDEIMDPTCTCYSETRQGLQRLIDKKWHVQGDTLQMRTAAVLNDGATEKRITATFLRTDNPTVDATGKVQEKPASPAFTDPFIFTIKKNANGVWLVHSRTLLEESKK